MRIQMRVLLAAAVCSCAAHASAEALNVEPGLWSVTYTYSLQGKPPAAMLASVPPESRAAMEKAWAARASQPETATTDSCITAEDVARGTAFEDDDSEVDCSRTVSTETATRWTGVEHCMSDAGASDRDLDIVAKNPKLISGSMNATNDGSAGGGMNVTFVGNWVAADCGDAE
jgi:Protein of unknown function (DUF3617)